MYWELCCIFFGKTVKKSPKKYRLCVTVAQFLTILGQQITVDIQFNEARGSRWYDI